MTKIIRLIILFLFAFALTTTAQLKKTSYISKKTVVSNEDKNERTETKENVYITLNDVEATIIVNYINRIENAKWTFKVYNKQVLKDGKMHYYTLYENKYNIAHVSVFFVDGEINIMLSYPEPDTTVIYFGPVKKQ